MINIRPAHLHTATDRERLRDVCDNPGLQTLILADLLRQHLRASGLAGDQLQEAMAIVGRYGAAEHAAGREIERAPAGAHHV